MARANRNINVAAIEYCAGRVADGVPEVVAAAEWEAAMDRIIAAEAAEEQRVERAASMWFAFPGDRANAAPDDPRSY